LNVKKNPIEIEIMKLGEKLDIHIEKYILDHAYSDKKILCALLGMILFCSAGFIGFQKKAYWGLLLGKNTFLRIDFFRACRCHSRSSNWE
jgi:hypothetical protein